MRHETRLASVLLAACVTPLNLAQAQQAAGDTGLDVKASGTKTFYVDQRVGANQVVINSESTIEDFTSIVNQVSGRFQVDPKRLETLDGRFSIRVADIRTGIDLRDRDLQGPEWLDAARYPEVTVTIKGAENVQKKSANSAALTLIGTLGLHGVTREMRVPATLIYLDESPVTQKRAKGDLIAIRSNFEFKLSDHNITGPKTSETIGLKVSDVQKIRVSVFASSEPPPPPLEEAVEPSATGPAIGPGTQPAEPGRPALPLPPRPANP